MNYVFTPEFHRNLWLKISPFRLVAAPVFLVICSLICVNILPSGGSASAPAGNAIDMMQRAIFDKDYAMQFMMTGAKWFYFLIVCVWGTYEAALALQEEVRSNTWDFQRMSSISPFQLVAGKMAGATSYVWYVGLLTLIPFYYGYINTTEPGNFTGSLNPTGERWTDTNDFYVLFYMVLAGLVGQSLAFLVSFIDMTSFAGKMGKKRIPRGSGAFLLGVMASWFVFTMGQEVAPKLASYSSPFAANRVVDWYGSEIASPLFVTWSLLFFFGWALVGSYRIARAELMHRTYPVAWIGFVASFLLYLRGFADPENAFFYTQLMALFVVALMLAYAVMLFEASDGRKYARFFNDLREGNYRRAFENTHKWAVTIPFILICYVVTLNNVPVQGKFMGFQALAAFMLAAMLFALRDGLMIHALIGGKGSRNAGFKVMSYYVLVYVMLPTLHFAMMPNKLDLKFASWAQRYLYGMNVDIQVPDVVRSLAVYYPLPLKEFSDSLAPVALQAIVAALLLRWTIQRARDQRLKAA